MSILEHHKIFQNTSLRRTLEASLSHINENEIYLKRAFEWTLENSIPTVPPLFVKKGKKWTRQIWMAPGIQKRLLCKCPRGTTITNDAFQMIHNMLNSWFMIQDIKVDSSRLLKRFSLKKKKKTLFFLFFNIT